MRLKEFQEVSLGKLDKQMNLRSTRNVVDILGEGLKTVRTICSEILKLKHRLEVDDYFTSVDIALNPSKMNFDRYE